MGGRSVKANDYLIDQAGFDWQAMLAGWADILPEACARRNFIHSGACDPASVERARPPNIEEVPTPAVVWGLESDKRDAAIRGIKTLLLGIVRAMLSDRISTFDGCTSISALSWPFVSEAESAAYSIFDGVVGEIEDLPNAHTRQLWSPEALVREDAKAAEYEDRVKASVKAACARLRDQLSAELLG
jgi:hypothetical protein